MYHVNINTFYQNCWLWGIFLSRVLVQDGMGSLLQKNMMTCFCEVLPTYG